MNMADKKAVLLVEDEKDIREVYAEVLKDAGFEVMEAADGLEGKRLAVEKLWDIMLLDIMIPELDGMSLLKELRSDDRFSDRPIIMLTNLGNEHIITEALSMGAQGYLIKAEITPDKIINEVGNYLKDQR